MNNLYREDHFFARFEFGHAGISATWISHEEIERYWAYQSTQDERITRRLVISENADGTITVAPGSFEDYSRIDMMLLAERGRTRNLVGPTADFYAETAWSLGGILGAISPSSFMRYAFNYKVN